MTDETTDTSATEAADSAMEGQTADEQGTTTLTGDETSAAAGDTAAADAGTEGEAPGAETGEDGQDTAPETYADFAMPEGMEPNVELLEAATSIFKELGLTQEQAQKLVDLNAQQVQAGEAGQVEAYNQMMDDWKNDSMQDKEFGGDAFEENVGIARAAVDKFGTPELKELLETHGLGNHPEMIRFMIKVGRLTAEDVPGSSGSPSQSKKDRAETLYPT